MPGGQLLRVFERPRGRRIIERTSGVKAIADTEIEQLLARDHDELDALLERVFAAIASNDFDLTYRSLDLFWARLAMHIRAEHLHLFPAVLAGAGAGVTETVRGLHDDHDLFMRELAAAVKLMRAADADAAVLDQIRERVEVVRQKLAAHNRIEEEKIYCLADAESRGLIASVVKEITNLPPRFRRAEE